MTWREGWGVAQELLNDPTSRTYASVKGWRYAPSEVERVGLDLFEAWMNTQRRKGTTPIVLKRPWELNAAGGAPAVVDVEDPERLEALARLEVLTSLGPEMPEPESPSD